MDRSGLHGGSLRGDGYGGGAEYTGEREQQRDTGGADGAEGGHRVSGAGNSVRQCGVSAERNYVGGGGDYRERILATAGDRQLARRVEPHRERRERENQRDAVWTGGGTGDGEPASAVLRAERADEADADDGDYEHGYERDRDVELPEFCEQPGDHGADYTESCGDAGFTDEYRAGRAFGCGDGRQGEALFRGAGD